MMTTNTAKSCFVVMPFSVREVDLAQYSNDARHWGEVYTGLIKPAVQLAGFQCERDDEDVTTRLIAENVWRKIEDADLVLCDLSSLHPNVYLEVGWALRADKKVVLIKDDITDLSFDISQFYTFEYSHRLQPTALSRAVPNLAEVLRSTSDAPSSQYSLVDKLELQSAVVRAVADGNVEVGLLNDLISEVRALAAAGHQRPLGTRPGLTDLRITVDLEQLLPGTTWRKKNDMEHMIFAANGVCYNNHAGHAFWRENQYSLGDEADTVTVVWNVDGARSTCRFNDRYSEFVEEENPEGVWYLVSREPHTPPWGV